MGRLSETKLKALAMVIEAAPDAVLLAIRGQLKQTGGAAAATVLQQVEQALAQREALLAVFSPVSALCGPRNLSIHDPFRADVPRRLWRKLAGRRPAQTQTIVDAAMQGTLRELPPRLADGLCAEAASVIRECPPAELGFSSDTEADRFIAYLDLVPIARTAIERLEDWIGRLDEERAAALRLTFRDADRVREDARPLLMDMLGARLPSPAQVMRLVAAVTDNASQAFVESSEMARIGERLVSRAEEIAAQARIGGRQFGPDDAPSATRDLEMVADIIAEFDLAFPPHARGGTWSSRLAAARKRMTDQLETALREVERAVERAFPPHAPGGRPARRPDPGMATGVDPAQRARALIVLAAGCRASAAAFGCESIRRQGTEAAAERLDRFSEDLLHALHCGDADDPAEAKATLELIANLLALARNEAAGALLRRRIAVAERTWDGDAAA